jgi:hypothetical protein
MYGQAAAGTEEGDGFGVLYGGGGEEEEGVEPGAATGFGALQLQTGRGMQQQKQRRRIGRLPAVAAAGDVGGGYGLGGLQGFALDDSQRSDEEGLQQAAGAIAQLLTKGVGDR